MIILNFNLKNINFNYVCFQIKKMPIERGLQYLRQMQRITLKNLPMPLEKTEKWKKEHVRDLFYSSKLFLFFLAG